MVTRPSVRSRGGLCLGGRGFAAVAFGAGGFAVGVVLIFCLVCVCTHISLLAVFAGHWSFSNTPLQPSALSAPPAV